MQRVKQLAKLSGSLILFLIATAQATTESAVNLPRGVTPISKDIFYLHMAIFWICVGIGVIVFGVLIYSLFKHRKSVGHKPADFHSSIKVETIWAVIPFILLVIMAVPATRVLMKDEDFNKRVASKTNQQQSVNNKEQGRIN